MQTDEKVTKQVGEARWEADSLFDKYSAYKERFALCAKAEDCSLWSRALHMLAARQVEHLDSISELTAIGRPSCAYALLRGMYETHLGLLLLGFHSGRRVQMYKDSSGNLQSFLVRNSSDKFSKKELSARFHAFSDFQAFQELHAMMHDQNSKTMLINHVGSTKILSETYNKAKRQSDSAVANFGFTSKSHAWHPFRSTWHLQHFLWPKGRAPRFPRETFEMAKSFWRFWYAYLYRVPSHDVHASPFSMQQQVNKGGSTAYISDAVVFDPLPLSLANTLFECSSIALALAFKTQKLHSAAFSLEVSPTRLSSSRLRVMPFPPKSS